MMVLHVDTAREWRGGQTQLALLARLSQGDCVVALPPDALLRPALEAAGVQVRPVPFRGRMAGTSELGRVVQELRPDVVAAHTAHALVHADRLGARTVAHRRLDFVPSRAGLRRLGRAAGVIAVSGAVAAVLGARGVPDVAVVRDGIDPDPETATVEAGPHPLLVAVGALVPHKGHAVLVDALAYLPGVRVVVLGEGPLRGSLIRQARRRGVLDRFELLGHRPDVGAWLRAADLVVHPSLQEGLGQVVVEALVQGAAVVASRTGGVTEVVEGLGLLVPPGDPRALARAITAGLARRDALRVASASARLELLERFGSARMARETEAAYARFLR